MTSYQKLKRRYEAAMSAIEDAKEAKGDGFNPLTFETEKDVLIAAIVADPKGFYFGRGDNNPNHWFLLVLVCRERHRFGTFIPRRLFREATR